MTEKEIAIEKAEKELRIGFFIVQISNMIQKPDNFLQFRYKAIPQKEGGDGKGNYNRKGLKGVTHRLFYCSNFKYDREA